VLQQRLWHDRKSVERAAARAKKHELHRDAESPVCPKSLADGLGVKRSKVKEARWRDRCKTRGRGVTVIDSMRW
jgi:hypothetical protein